MGAGAMGGTIGCVGYYPTVAILQPDSPRVFKVGKVIYMSRLAMGVGAMGGVR